MSDQLMTVATTKPLFIPVLHRPSGDRYATFAVYDVLRQWPQDANFAVTETPIEAYDERGDLKKLSTLEAEIKKQVQHFSYSQAHHAVLFYTGHDLIDRLKSFEAKKFATTHLQPQELLDLIKGDSDAENWNHISLRDACGLDMLACPAHMAVDISDDTLNDPSILWAFGVSTRRAAVDPDLSHDPVLKNAHQKPIFVVSLPTPGAAIDKEILELLVRVIHHEETLNERDIILVDNPRSKDFKDALLDALGKDYPIIGDMGAFTQRVLPAIKAHPQSKLFLPGDSASVLTESVEVLPWHHLIVNAAVYKDTEHRRMVPFFFNHGCIQLLDETGKIVKPQNPAPSVSHTAQDIAAAAVEKFVYDEAATFDKPHYMPQAANK